jgi:hypothetical protein
MYYGCSGEGWKTYDFHVHTAQNGTTTFDEMLAILSHHAADFD